MCRCTTKEATIISDNKVSRWHNPVQYGSNTFFLELGSDPPPPPGWGMDEGGAEHGGARVDSLPLYRLLLVGKKKSPQHLYIPLTP